MEILLLQNSACLLTCFQEQALLDNSDLVARSGRFIFRGSDLLVTLVVWHKTAIERCNELIRIGRLNLDIFLINSLLIG